MRLITNFIQKLNKRADKMIIRISLVSFLISCLVGLSLGIFFREFRRESLIARQEAQKIEEEKRLNNLFKKFSQLRSIPQR